MSNGRARARGIATVVLAVVCSGTVVHAQLSPADALTPVIGKLPLSTRVVVVSARPDDVLSELQGPWKRLGPVATGIGGDTLKSWSMLARRLGYEPDGAFSALTSGGLALVVAEAKVSVAAGVGEGGRGGTVKDVRASVDASWAVLAVVKRDVAVRVRERLKAVPHEVIAGQPVLSVEDGRFALVCRALSDAAGSDEVLALTPTEDRVFLESIVASVEAARPGAAVPARRDAAPTLSSTRAFAAGQARATDVLVLSADEEAAGNGGAAKPWERASVVACSLKGRAWSFDAELIAPRADGEPATSRLPAEASGWFDAWAPGAALMIVGGGSSELQQVLHGMGWPLVQKDERLEGVGFFSGINAEARMSAWCGVRVSGGVGGSGGASVMDAAGEALAGYVERGEWLKELAESAKQLGSAEPGSEKWPAATRFAAADGSALRVMSLRIPPWVDLGAAGQEGVPSAPASLAWFQCAAAGFGAGENGTRWMVWGLEPTQEPDEVAAKHAAIKDCLMRPAGDERVWLWRAVVRPPRILQALPGPMAFAAGFTGVGAVGEVRFESWQEPGANGGQRARVVVEWTGGGAKDAAPKQ